MAGFLYLAKAFDCIHHGILLFKLEQYGIVGSAYSWFEDYLFSRQQHVSFQGCLSEWCTVSVGVPQGSIFGSLLYSIYVNDLPTVVRHSQVNMCADDTDCISVDMTCSLCSAIFSVTLMLFMPGCMSIDFN